MRSVPIFTDEVALAGGWHGQALATAMAKRGAQAHFISLDACQVSIVDQQVSVHLPGIHSLPSVAFVRGVAAGTTQQIITRLNILHTLQRQGVVVYNNAKAIESTVDKSYTSQRLAEAGLATPNTWVCEHRAQAHDIIAAAQRRGQPLIIKPLFGSQGKGVRLITPDQAWPLPQDRFVDGVFYLQEKIATGQFQYDYRVFVIGERVIAMMQRQGSSWLHNVACGAKCTPSNEPDVAALGLKAARVLNMHYAGVDVIRDQHGQCWVIEVNSIPAWRGLQSITSQDIAQALVDDLLQWA